MDSGFYGPHTLTWRVTRETVMLLGGPRALLMQLAHPLVAAGVRDHSRFRQDPMRRLRRTLEATLSVVFGDRDEAMAAASGINAVHAHVRGTLGEAVGRYGPGTVYDARDPELLLWVHATLVDTTLLVYPRYVEPLGERELAALYEESKVAARLLLVPDEIVPPDLPSFREYVRRTVASDAIAIGGFQRQLAADVLYPAVAFVPRRAHEVGTSITTGLLPAKVRSGYGLELTPWRRRVYEWSPAVVRPLLPLFPSVVRQMPQARRAYRRIGA